MQMVIDIDEYDYEKVKELVSDGVFDYEGTTAHLFKSVVNGTPTHKKGKWVNDPYEDFLPHCSNCDSAWSYAENMNYCPNCGAEMRGNKE